LDDKRKQGGRSFIGKGHACMNFRTAAGSVGLETAEGLEFPRVGLYSELPECSPIREIEKRTADE
jgi:hypothetical protein